MKNKILIIIGPTSSGKSELAVKLAKKFHGEIISCDSRQIYKGMDLGTGKITGKWKKNTYTYKSIPHHMIDFQNPSRQYSAALFQNDANKIIGDILARGKLPILCGGTMHWIDAIAFGQKLPNVEPNLKLRAKLEKQSAGILYEQLIKLDPVRASNIDKFNKRRLIRAIEIIISTGKPVPIFKSVHLKSLNYKALWIGIQIPQTELYKKIDIRLKKRIKEGLVKEVKNLRKKGLTWKRLIDFGLEYKYVSLFLQKKIPYDEMFTQLSFAIKHYSKRQMTWWKKNKDIFWIKPDAKKAHSLTKKFLSE